MLLKQCPPYTSVIDSCVPKLIYRKYHYTRFSVLTVKLTIIYILYYWQVFTEVAYKAKSRDDLLAGVDEYIDDLTVLPPSIWDAGVRLEPPSQTRSMVGHYFDVMMRKVKYYEKG